MPYDPFQEPLNSPRNPSFAKPIPWQPPEPPVVDPQIPPKGFAGNPFAPFRDLVRPPIGALPALPAAAENPGILGRLAPLAGRLLPYGLLALPFIIPKILEPFAPGVQDWLKRGWKGQPGYGIPDGLSPGSVAPGSTSNLYSVKVDFDSTAYTCEKSASEHRVYPAQRGPISKVVVDDYGVRDVDCFPYKSKAARIGWTTAGTTVITGTLYYAVPGNTFDITPSRLDGTPEGVPDPSAPPVIVPYAPLLSPKQGNSPLAPDPQRARDPRTLNPYPTEGGKPLPLLPPSQRPGGRPALPPATSPQQGVPPTPRPQGSPQQGGSPQSLPQPSAPPSPPSQIPGSETCEDPCLERITRQLEEIKKKQDENNGSPADNCPKTQEFSFTSISCKDGAAKSEVITITAVSPVPQSVYDSIRVMADLAIAGCGGDYVVTQPDWWQVRLGAERPQIVVAFRSGKTRTYHQISVPHPINIEKWKTNLLGNYEKGSYQGSIILLDNSKFTINCASEAEAKRMIAKAKTLINPAYLTGNSQDRIALRRGNTVQIGGMIAVKAQYFSTGQKNLKADWTTKLAAI